MPARTRRAALAASVALLSLAAGPGRADAPLATAGGYALTPPLVDADAAYYGWAAGRTLTPDERRRLAAIDVARFRRDPAWSVKALTGEQKNLTFFRTLPTSEQDGLRRTVLADIADTQHNRLTPDEARQVQQIAAGVPQTGAPQVSDTPPPAVPHPAPAPATRPAALTGARLPLRVGRFTLTQAMLDDDLTIWRLVVGRPLAAADRQQVAAVDADIFRRDPAWLAANMRQTHKALPGLRRADAVGQARLRQANLVDQFCHPQSQHLSPDDAARMQAVLRRYVPIVGVDAANGVVVTGRDIDAWVAATRFFNALAHVPPPPAGYRADLVRLARTPSALGALAEPEAVGVEGNWAACQRVWPHLGAAQRAQVLGQRLVKLKRAAAHGQGASLEAAVALQASQDAAQQYPYALDPRLEAFKMRMQMRQGLFNQHMMEYNMKNMLDGQENYRRGLRGEGPLPDTNVLPVP